MMGMVEHVLWSEKYRPRSVAECILPEDMKKIFQNIVDPKKVPNMLFCGGPGVGKTTVARAMLEELGCDYIVINGSMNGNIDTLRTEIKDFASTISLSGGRKFVLLDEADHLTALTQAALRNFMEEYSSNCGFIMTCNYPAKIIDALHSRCPPIYFKIENKEKTALATQFLKKAKRILQEENVQYDVKAVAELISKHFPDWRRCINEMQRYSNTGSIDLGVLKDSFAEEFKNLIVELKAKNFKNVRAWVGANSDIASADFFRYFYDNAYDFLRKDSIPMLIIHIAEYQFKSAFVADQEVNMVAFLTHVMSDCEFV